MGLREKKAARTRQRLIDVALDLFVRDGYDETTMEQIAERAEVGTTTLYRYFPTKDLLLIDRLADVFDLAGYLRARPAGEPLDHALGGALADAFRTLDEPEHRIPEVRRLIDAASTPRARLWDFYHAARRDLEAEISARTGADPAAVWVRTSAGITYDVFLIVSQTHASEDGARTFSAILDEVIDRIDADPFVVPARGTAPRS
jgi:AcrR family transcriptional regulator